MMSAKRNRVKLLKIVSFVLTGIILFINPMMVFATSGHVTTPDSYRPYYEWMNKPTAGVQRLQKIYVYANEGETIYFGSSTKTNLSAADVKTSLKTSFGYAVGGCASACMAVTLPYDYDTTESNAVKYSNNGMVNDFEGIANSNYNDTNIYLFQRVEGETAGVINDYQQEMAGPAALDSSGYEAYSFVAPVSGVYTFRFFGEVISATNPKPAKVNSAYLSSGATVAAFDVTVADGAGEKIDGREFTDVLLQNVGANNVSIEETLYVLTSDGFEYSVSFNDLDPWGFVFFANKRGLLVSNSEDGQDDGVHYRSLLRSVYSKNSDLSDVRNMGVFINAIPQNEIDDESYYIFFDHADSDVIKWYTGQEALASGIKESNSNISNFTFRGFNAGNINTGIEGLGGYFSFNYTPTEANNASGVNPTSFEVVLDFSDCSNINEKYNYPANTKNEVILSNALEVGQNLIYWDGKDAFGNTVPKNEADYNVVSLYAKAGEVHFPLIDVEGNKGGIVVRMLNEEISDRHNDGYDVFYNNSKSAVYTYGNTIADNADYSQQAIDSRQGVMKYNSTKGNQTILDLWTNYRMQESLWSGSIRIINLDDTCIEADTNWQYYYQDESARKHYDSSHTLPLVSNVELQYRIIDKTIGDASVADVTDTDWQETDLDIWKKYEGKVLTHIYVKDGDSYRIAENEIQLSATADSVYNPETGENTGQYGYIAIPNYEFVDNSADSKTIYPYDSGGGKCLLYGLPTQVIEDGTPVDKYYQYRVVDRRVYQLENDSVLQTYDHSQQFGKEIKYEIRINDTDVLNKTFYQKESLYYEYEPEIFELPIAQLWDDAGMSEDWRNSHRPKAVQVAIMYGVKNGPLETDIVWRRIQQTKYMTLYYDGKCFDDAGNPYNLSKLSEKGVSDAPYSGYYPVWKYTTNNHPYYYKIVPVGYSMNGIDFVDVNYDDYVLPDYYALKSSESILYDPAHDAALHGGLYKEWATITDFPAMAEIDLTKTNEAEQRIIGSSARYSIKDANGMLLYFTKISDGAYRYVGKTTEEQISGYSTVVDTSDKNSKLSITELPLESFLIQEISAPEGYLVDSNPIVVNYSDYKDSNTVRDGYEVYTLLLSHADKENIVLPDTGGSGTGDFIKYGLCLIGIALLSKLYYINYFKREREI